MNRREFLAATLAVAAVPMALPASVPQGGFFQEFSFETFDPKAKPKFVVVSLWNDGRVTCDRVMADGGADRIPFAPGAKSYTDAKRFVSGLGFQEYSWGSGPDRPIFAMLGTPEHIAESNAQIAQSLADYEAGRTVSLDERIAELREAC